MGGGCAILRSRAVGWIAGGLRFVAVGVLETKTVKLQKCAIRGLHTYWMSGWESGIVRDMR